MRMTHHELRRSARSANANMLPHESTSTGRPSPRKLQGRFHRHAGADAGNDHEHDRRHEVRDEVLAHDEGKPRAHAARGEDVLAVADLPDFAPDNAGQGEPAGDADDESDGELVRFAHERKDQQQGQKDRDTLQEFHRPHHGAVHHAGGDSGQAAVENPDKGNDRGAHQPDEDGSPAAVPDDRVNVPPQRVRAEPEFGIGSLIDVHEKEFGGIMVDDQVGKGSRGRSRKTRRRRGWACLSAEPRSLFSVWRAGAPCTRPRRS